MTICGEGAGPPPRGAARTPARARPTWARPARIRGGEHLANELTAARRRGEESAASSPARRAVPKRIDRLDQTGARRIQPAASSAGTWRTCSSLDHGRSASSASPQFAQLARFWVEESRRALAPTELASPPSRLEPPASGGCSARHRVCVKRPWVTFVITISERDWRPWRRY